MKNGYCIRIGNNGNVFLDRTADSIVQLSGLMRCIMGNNNGAVIELRSEINYISSYIALQKARLEDTVKIGYVVQGSTGNNKISPLILISFIENAFGYGVNSEENPEIDIIIEIDGKTLKLRVYKQESTFCTDAKRCGYAQYT